LGETRTVVHSIGAHVMPAPEAIVHPPSEDRLTRTG
jgi:hypothetical protein